ncbi:zinc-dependent metalloprotease [Kordiimonas sp. SCSIO 12610]|uniref:zinc-dependent metalloprotease n=1 Tax=Kordiimonas sp. SCSIO 12610 TaxID=2829597 RepID=UPI00210BB5DE|nr:zinc-dependent metalloprotease [Kordiimonas sp. SCSIO 12610]UTW56401.1 zinc-dependent metalloprotease [Kordiimonas sp. SCSIO 12610]
MKIGNFLMGMAATAGLLLSAVANADFAEAVKGLDKRSGLIETYVDTSKSRILLNLDAPNENGVAGRYIYAGYLTGGLGSNPVGLDRSVPGGSEIIVFKRVGDKVMAFFENTAFRASADNPSEKRAVETSFAQSIVWSAPIMETSDDGKLLVDATKLFMRDAIGVSARLASRGQGNFSIAADRSYVDTTETHVFPINMEVDAYLTFSGRNPGGEVRTTTPVPNSVTLIAHTTLMKLPEDGYEIRMNDDRAGVINTPFVDMSAPLDGNTVVSFARRFRLQKDQNGKVIKPIVFYVDNGAPEPIRSALVEGGNWWATAFEKAGFPGGYRVEVLPEGVHPLDARYNVVNWVHRATRGWSYGAALHDPRTGETLRGVVLLGSLRVRQDIKIFEALAGAAKTGSGGADDPVQMALARIRQLSAHEIGHALGFSHNMAASTYGDRASVMDYPAPHVIAGRDGSLDFSDVYGVGVGAWDDWVTNFLYGDYEGDEAEYQAKLIREADEKGLLFVSDPDSRSVGSGHPKGAVWDNGTDPIASLRNVLEVRRVALEKFGAANLRAGESYQALQTKFVPLYLYHRYQLAAAVKSLGGVDFEYRHQGDGRADPQYVAVEKQLEALDVLLSAIAPEALEIRDETIRVLSPLGFANGDPQFNREVFRGRAGPQFDAVNAVRVASDMTLAAILDPRRAARLLEQGVQQKGHPGLQGVLDRMLGVFKDRNKTKNEAHKLIQSVVYERFAERLISLMDDPAGTLPVRDVAFNTLRDMKSDLVFKRLSFGDAIQKRIDNALARANTPALTPPSGPSVPPGSPIGESCWHCDTAELFNVK